MTDTIRLEIEYKVNLETSESNHRKAIINTIDSLWFVESIEQTNAKGDGTE